MHQFVLPAALAVLLAVLVSAVRAQTTQPEPAVVGSDVCVRPAATGLKIICGNWPDPSSMRQFGLDAIRLENARTVEEKAVAIWRWVRRVTMSTGGAPPSQPNNNYVSEPALILNVYGDHHCDGLSRMVASVYRAAVGMPAMKLYRAGHTMADCWWIDDDGVGRWHMFDVNYGYFLYDRAGKHIVTADDLGVDFSLECLPSRTARPWLEKQWWMYAWIHVTWPDEANYDGTASLRPGERFDRDWGSPGARVYDTSALPAGPDPDGAAYPRTQGTGRFSFTVEFDKPSWRDVLACTPANVAVNAGRLAQADPSAPGEIILRSRSPYVVADVDVHVQLAGAGKMQIDTSIDNGRTWRAAWTLTQPGQAALTLSKVQPKYDVLPTRADRGRISRNTPIGRYDHLIRVRLTEGAELASIGLETFIQHNLLVLPTLIPGENAITISGQLTAGQAVRVEYEFDDADARGKRHVAVAESLPFTYTIQAAGKRWHDVLVRRVSAEVIPADGKANRVVSAPPPAKILPAGPIQTLDIRVLNAIVPESLVLQPADVQATRKVWTEEQILQANAGPFGSTLKTVDQYIADLASADVDVRRYAAAGLAVRRDPKAWDSLHAMAVADTTVAKYYAVQALFWTDAERAWPIMEKILRRDPSIHFAPDARDRVEQPTHLNMSAMVAALCGRARIAAAVPLITDVLTNHSRNWAEPRWAMLRALGRIGGDEAIATLRRYARGGPADTNTIALEGLIALGDRESIPLLVNCLATRGQNRRPQVGLKGLAVLKVAGHAEAIIPHLASRSEERRSMAADALAVCGQPDLALPALRAALQAEQFEYARQRIVAAIGELERS